MTTNSELFERAQRVIPGGVNSPVRAFKSVGGTPYFVARGEGAYVWDVEGTGLDPATSYSGTGWDAISDLLNSPLYSYSDQNQPVPNAAADMPQISADGLVYTIPLRPGVTFHNGRETVADDYVYAWQRVLDPKNQSWASSYITSIKGAQEVIDGKAKAISGVRAVDDRTLEVTLTAPDVTFLYSLTQPFMAAVPKEEVARLGKKFDHQAVGNGPFRVASYDAAGQRAIFARHDRYHWSPLPYLDEVEFRWGVDQNAQLLMLQKGEADVLGYGLTTRSLQRISASPSLKPFLFTQPLFACRWIALHQKRVPAFASQAVRQALNYATDREQIQRVTAGEAEAWGAPFPRAMLQQRTFTPYGYDPERARSLLASSGVTDLSATLWISRTSGGRT